MEEYEDEDDEGTNTFFLSDPSFLAPATAQGSRNRAGGGRVQYDEEWMFDSLAEQLARQEQQSAEEHGQDDEEDYDADFESRYYFSDDDMSDSMYFSHIHMMEEESRAAALAQHPARKSPVRAAAASSTATKAPTPAKVPEPTLCRFFVLGKCRYGSHCTYSHTLPDAARGCAVTTEEGLTAAAALVDCPFYQRGNCKYGDFCRLRHATGAPATIEVQSSTAKSGRAASNQASTDTTSSMESENQQEFTCGICFEDIVQSGKHFGLLACDHCYCLDCLRSWRQSKDMEAEVIRACPACRQPSDFVVPSLTFSTGEAKAQVIEAYKQHLSQRECKYFNGVFGSCPFGPHCFYAHRDANGRDVKHLDRPKRSAKSRRFNNRGGGLDGAALSDLLSNYTNLFRFLEMVELDDYSSDSDY